LEEFQGRRIHITGIVQGVGFRPFVYGLAGRLGLKGWVRNTSAGVDIEVDGDPDSMEAFIQGLQMEAPPLAVIEEVKFTAQPAQGFSSFEIIHSQPIEGAFQPISSDICVCCDCLNEMRAPADRRFRYPFINCTNCGPRFTIITGIPYDRPNTSMATFEMCLECSAEYSDPLDRRFHAQPVACPVCGPAVWVEPLQQNGADPLAVVQSWLSEGKIVAIKGLGGFHLACDASNPRSVQRLRELKLRVDKPFALMMPDLETVEVHCATTQPERQLLESRERPVVILSRRPTSTVSRQVSPGQDTLGVMLPYTPLHYLLFEPVPAGGIEPPKVLVMTSGNLSEEPIATDNEEARSRLASLADGFLMHDRPIWVRCDDSVLRINEPGQGTPSKHSHTAHFYRRSRGYAPIPISLSWKNPVILAVGGELKNTFCFTHERNAILSHHIGDLENFETLNSFQDGIQHFERLFLLKPQALAYDLHPDYLATRYALARAEQEQLPSTGVQHHHAHIAACMADNDLPPGSVVIGVALDGTGYGSDGAIWGGEFLLAGYQASTEHGLGPSGFRRLAHMSYMPLPGGDASIRTPARTALAYLWQAGIEWHAGLPSTGAFKAQELDVLCAQLEQRINTPLTSSMGRLFDAVASLAGVRQKINYEAQAAVELEAMADPDEEGEYPFEILRPEDGNACYRIDPAPLLGQVVKDIQQKHPAGAISARFHNGCARLIAQVCQNLRQESGINGIALSGGVWHNTVLLKKSAALLEQDGFTVYLHNRVPTNDGGLALGQAVIAARRLDNQE
jgi:hydrogenase maturation protein HypF